jgi:hypothetical protein
MNPTVKASTPREVTVLSPSTNTSTSAISLTTSVTPASAGYSRSAGSNKNVENAVYAHIQAMRTLGRTKINTSDIATALGLPVAEVDKTIAALRKKGVKVA